MTMIKEKISLFVFSYLLQRYAAESAFFPREVVESAKEIKVYLMQEKSRSSMHIQDNTARLQV